MNRDLSISLVQSPLKWNDTSANLKHFQGLITGLKTDVVVLPEMFTTGFNMEPDGVEVFDLNGQTVTWMKQQAKALDALVMGSIATEDSGSHFNRLLAVKPNGDVATYDKRHLFSFAGEDQAYTAGRERLVVEWQGWKLCPMICYDLRFPVFSRNTMEAGGAAYDGLIYVANWPSARVHAWSDLLKARAHENACYVAGCNRVGEDANGNAYSGASVAVNMKGKVLVEGGASEQVLQCTWSAEDLSSYRAKFPVLSDADGFDLKH